MDHAADQDFSPTRRVFLTKDERESKPWERILRDPSFSRTFLRRDCIDQDNIQRLSPGLWLDDDIVNAYMSLCAQAITKGKTRVLSTFFWNSVAQKRGKKNSTAFRSATTSFMTQTVS